MSSRSSLTCCSHCFDPILHIHYNRPRKQSPNHEMSNSHQCTLFPFLTRLRSSTIPALKFKAAHALGSIVQLSADNSMPLLCKAITHPPSSFHSPLSKASHSSASGPDTSWGVTIIGSAHHRRVSNPSNSTVNEDHTPLSWSWIEPQGAKRQADE